MPRRKKIEDEQEAVQGEEVATQYVNFEDVKAKRLLHAIPGGSKCMSVFRYPVGNKGGRPSYIDDISPDQFSYQSIKQIFGGGKFSIEWEDEKGKLTKSILEVEGPRFKFDEDEPEKEPAKLVRPADEEEDGPIHVQTGRSYPHPGPDHGGISPIELMKVIQDAQDRGEQRILKILELTKPERVEQSPDMTKQIFELAEKVVGMSSQMGGGEGGGSPLLAALAMFKEPIQQIVQTIHAAVNRPAMPVNPPIHPQTAPVQHMPIQQNPPKQEVDVVTMMLSRYLPMFIEAASTNEDVNIYADMILAKIPESQYTVLHAWINKPDCLDGLAQINPAIGYQKAWWIQLRQSIIEGLNDALQPDSTPEQSEQD